MPMRRMISGAVQRRLVSPPSSAVRRPVAPSPPPISWPQSAPRASASFAFACNAAKCAYYHAKDRWSVNLGYEKTRVADPDPYPDPDPDWIRIQSGHWIRKFRIRIRNPDPDPGGQKWPTKVVFFFLSSCFEVLDGLFWELKASSVTWTFFMEA